MPCTHLQQPCLNLCETMLGTITILLDNALDMLSGDDIRRNILQPIYVYEDMACESGFLACHCFQLYALCLLPLTLGMTPAILLLPMFLLNHALHKSQGSGHMLRVGIMVFVLDDIVTRHKPLGVQLASGTNSMYEDVIRHKQHL